MILFLVLALTAVAVVSVIPRGAKGNRRLKNRCSVRYAMRYRFRRVRLPRDWWEQFERDFAAYVDPRAARARDRERS
jgi:hypothetical protein